MNHEAIMATAKAIRESDDFDMSDVTKCIMAHIPDEYRIDPFDACASLDLTAKQLDHVVSPRGPRYPLWDWREDADSPKYIHPLHAACTLEYLAEKNQYDWLEGWVRMMEELDDSRIAAERRMILKGRQYNPDGSETKPWSKT